MKEFAPLTQDKAVDALCSWTDPPACVATPVAGLQWRLHGRHAYYLSVKLEGVNGLERVVSTTAYEHYVGPPSGGVVVEIPENTTEMVSLTISDHSMNERQLSPSCHMCRLSAILYD